MLHGPLRYLLCIIQISYLYPSYGLSISTTATLILFFLFLLSPKDVIISGIVEDCVFFPPLKRATSLRKNTSRINVNGNTISNVRHTKFWME